MATTTFKNDDAFAKYSNTLSLSQHFTNHPAINLVL